MKQSTFMLIYWHSMKRNALHVLWLIHHQDPWSGKGCEAADTYWTRDGRVT